MIPLPGTLTLLSGDGEEKLIDPPEGSFAVEVVAKRFSSWPAPPSGAEWVAHACSISDEDARNGRKIHIRRQFDLPPLVVRSSIRARVKSFVDDYLNLEVNGKEVAQHRGFESAFTPDISGLLRQEQNTIDFYVTNRVGGPTETGRSNPMGLCYRIEIDYEYY